MKRTLALVVAALALIAAGCGSSNNSSNNNSGGTSSQSTNTTASTPPASSGSKSGGKSTNLKIAADPSGQLKFDKSSLTAKSGSVTITMANPSSVPHGVAITGAGANQSGQVVNKGGTSTVTANLKPGKYTFYCPVPGHRQAGMEGTLTVK